MLQFKHYQPATQTRMTFSGFKGNRRLELHGSIRSNKRKEEAWPSRPPKYTTTIIIALLMEGTGFAQYKSTETLPSFIFLKNKHLLKNLTIEEKCRYFSRFLKHNHIVFMILPENRGEKKKPLKTPIPEAKTIPTFTVYELNAMTQAFLSVTGPLP